MTTTQDTAPAGLGDAIASRVGQQRFELWFARHTKFRTQDGVLVVGVPNHFFQEWLEKTFSVQVAAAAAETLGRPTRVRFEIDGELFRAARREQAETPAPVPQVALNQTPLVIGADRSAGTASPRRRTWRRLADFVVGACNRLAHAAALALIEGSCEANPVVIHGPVGTGKTHLLEAVYAAVSSGRPPRPACYATSEEFTNRFLQAMRGGKLPAFRLHFRACETLLVDDLQFLAGKRATQEEFLHTLDAVGLAGGRVVVSSDCHPRYEDDFLPELRDRLLGGGVWGVTPPDETTRLAILRAKALSLRAAAPEPVLRFLATRLRGNVRELEGALHTLAHHARVVGRPVDESLAREALTDVLAHCARPTRLADVEASVCRAFGVEPALLRSRQRSWAAAHPRMLAAFLARRHTSAAYSEIGQHFGGRNHSTIVAAEKKVRRWLDADSELSLGGRRLRARQAVELAERELLR